MTYSLLECIKEKDVNGNDIIFLEVAIIDDNENLYHYAEWLLPEDVALILADENNIDTIAAQVAERGVLAHNR